MGNGSIIHQEQSHRLGMALFTAATFSMQQCGLAEPQLSSATQLHSRPGDRRARVDVWHLLSWGLLNPGSWRCWKQRDVERAVLLQCLRMAFPFRRETRITRGWRRDPGRTCTEKETEEERPSASSLLHILPFWSLHSLPKELCKILSNPYSSISTPRVAAWTDMWPASSRKKKEQKIYILTS